MGYIENRNSTTFNIYGDCNQKCPFCSGYPRISFELEKIKKQIKGLKEISLQGGEPTMSPYLLDIINYARQNGTKYINLITNGLKLSDSKFASALKGKIDCYHIAFMSHKKDKADFLGGSKNTLFLKTKGILNLLKLGEGKKIRLVHIIQKDNINDLEELPFFIKKRFPGVNLIEFKYLQYFGNKNNIGKIIKYSEYKDKINRTFNICNKLGINFIINGIPLCFLEKKFHINTSNYYNNISKDLMNNFSTIKLKKCIKCDYSSSCIGVRKDYLLLNGDDEFI